MNNGSRGHCAMIFSDLRWHLCAIWRLDANYIHAYLLVSDKSSEFSLHEFSHILDEKSNKVVFVSVYGFDTDDEATDPRNLAFLNSIDGCWNIGVRPTTIWLPLPAMQVSYSKDGGLTSKPRGRPTILARSGSKKRKRGNRKRSRLGNQRHKDSSQFVKYPIWLYKHKKDLDVEALTIYVMKSDCDNCFLAKLARRKKQEENSFLVLKVLRQKSPVDDDPEGPFRVVDFCVVRKSDIASLNGLNRDGVLSYLASHETFQLLDFKSNTYPVRFVLFPDINEPRIRAIKGINSRYFNGTTFYYEFSRHSMASLPGVGISVWDHLDSAPSIFDWKDARMIQDSFGDFFGSRSSVPCGGVNGYLGPRLSHRPLPTPGVGPGTVYTASYHRQYFDHDHYQTALVKRVEQASEIVLEVPRKHNSLYRSFVDLDTCSRTIWTQGQMPNRSTMKVSTDNVAVPCKGIVVTHPFLGFYNSVHFDHCDSLSINEYNPWFKDLESFMELPGYRKLKEVESLIGIGLPTTCGYNIPREGNLHAYFCQMMFCTSLSNGAVHHFFGWSMPHCTAVPCATFLDDQFKTLNDSNEEKQRLVLAWGKSGGSGHAQGRNARTPRFSAVETVENPTVTTF